ncbi:MAG: hypothetical protein ACI9KE_001328 [Polyangiales bacterium]|jgi:hypothetical protein
MDAFPWPLQLLSALVCFLPFLEMSVLFVMLYALSRVRIVASEDEVYLDGVDPWTMIGFVAGGTVLTTVLFLSLGVAAGCLSASLSFLAALGCRVELWVTSQGSRFTRRLFGFLPWSVWHSDHAATLFVDGWGDMMDPEALHVSFGLGSLELGWGGAKSGERADELVAEFSEAVRTLRALVESTRR